VSLTQKRRSLRKDADPKADPAYSSHGFSFKISLLTFHLLDFPQSSSQTLNGETPRCTSELPHMEKDLPCREIRLPQDRTSCRPRENRLRSNQTGRLSGSMTVEASIVLPLVLCLLVTVIFFMRILTIQHQVGQIMDETVREGAIYGTPVSEDGKRGVASADIDPSMQGLLTARFYQKALESDLETEYIQGGVMGLNLLASHVDRTDIRLTVNYAVKLKLPFFGQDGLQIKQTASTRRWVGWNPSMENDGDSRQVFVTPHGSAYHLSRDCSYLNIRVEPVSKWTIGMRRSSDGSKYYACPFCRKGKSDTYYIANYGNRYHTRQNCPAIKRTVRQISKAEAERMGYHACSKCGGL
jgi:hypothetical protein